MTREDILNMEAGRELDRLVDEKIFGIHFETDIKKLVKDFSNKKARVLLNNGCYINKNHDLIFDKDEYNKLFEHGHYIPKWEKWLIDNSKIRYSIENYSTSISSAWQIVEKIKTKKESIQGLFLTELRLLTKSNNEFFLFALTPLAICKAALLTTLEEE